MVAQSKRRKGSDSGFRFEKRRGVYHLQYNDYEADVSWGRLLGAGMAGQCCHTQYTKPPTGHSTSALSSWTAQGIRMGHR